MDYSVGSIADLISGKSTPNKQKVVQKEFKNVVLKTEKKKKTKTILQKQIHVVPENAILKHKKRSRSDIQADGEIVNKKKKSKMFTENSSQSVTKPTEQSNEKNAEKRIKKKIKTASEEQVCDRTIFVGNVPLSVPKAKLKKLFMKYGHVDSLRLRGVPVADPRVPKKVAFIKREFHPDRNSLHCYVRFSTDEEARKALQLNGYVYQNHHLRVMMAGEKVKPDENKSIFIGNVSFNAEEEELWQLFEPCGKISSVRLIRDAATGIGKGFGYINFENSDSVELALQMENPTLKGRELRVSICNATMEKKKKGRKVFVNQLKGAAKKTHAKGSEKPQKRSITVRKAVPEDRSASLTKKKKKKRASNNDKETSNLNDEQEPAKNYVSIKKNEFEGSQFTDKKKKKKVNKGLLQKKKLIKKFAPKPNATSK